MADRAEGSIQIAATPAEILEVIADFEAYPEWAGVKTAEILEKDEDGWPRKVAMSISQMGFDASYTLEYDYLEDYGGLSWVSTETSGALKRVEGEYVLEPAGDAATKVTYRLSIDLSVRVPGFLKRQGEKQAINTALDGLKKRVEAG
jgi:ribosome-associated toxin RatA of RatAB toxin-antitoxin module